MRDYRRITNFLAWLGVAGTLAVVVAVLGLAAATHWLIRVVSVLGFGTWSVLPYALIAAWTRGTAPARRLPSGPLLAAGTALYIAGAAAIHIDAFVIGAAQPPPLAVFVLLPFVQLVLFLPMLALDRAVMRRRAERE